MTCWKKSFYSNFYGLEKQYKINFCLVIFKFHSVALIWIIKFLFFLRIFAILLFYFFCLSNAAIMFNFNFFPNTIISLELDLFLDTESSIFFFCVSWISFAVFRYGVRYIRTDIHQDRFFLLLLRFVFSMFILVFRSNFFCIIIGWDGLGVTSFLLVVYFQNKTSFNAGMITVITNRIGDVLLLSSIAILLSLNQWNTLMMRLILPREHLSVLSLLIIFGAFTKSAQIPFSRWLPAAMAAPTPVSSLVHSRTLVTAGIYLLLRFKRFFIDMSIFPVIFGCLTMCMAGLSGLFEIDFKKIVALSTLRQLGLIIARFGLGAFAITLFHLITHAFFKALLFLATGITIHSAKDYQDLRYIRVPRKRTPRTIAIFWVANLRLIGFPFLAGFYSKDLILELILSQRRGSIILVLFFVGTALTVIYTIRFLLFSRRSYLKARVCFSHSEENSIVFSSYDYLFWLAVSRGALLNWFYLKFAPVLFLTREAKNFTLLIILRLLGLIVYARTLLSRRNNLLFLKWSLRSIWSLVFLRTRIYKKYAFLRTSLYEKLREKWIIQRILFSHNATYINVYSPISKIRTLSSFYTIFFAWVFLRYLIYPFFSRYF